MRATINFEVDVEQVQGTMAVLIAEEAHSLRAAADIIDQQVDSSSNVLEEITHAMSLLETTTTQLQEYRDMLVSFERARFETKLPQPVAAIPVDSTGIFNSLEELRGNLDQVKDFTKFLEKTSEEPSDTEAKEG